MFQRSLTRARVIVRHVKMSAQFTTAAEDEVILQNVGCKGLITLNRPKALNSLNLSMIRKIYPQMVAWENDPTIGMVIIRGVGEKAFCAGGDVKEITDAGKVGGKLTQEFFKEEYILNNKIGMYKKPFVAVIDGITMGGGVGLSVHGRYRVATEHTMFAMPETAIGLFPDVGGGHFLPRLKGQLGLFLALTGFRLKGRDVHKAGVATHYVNAEKVAELENRLLELESPSHEQVLDTLNSYHNECEVGQEHRFILEPHLAQIDQLFCGVTLEEIFHNLERDGSEWANKQLNILKKMSPTSMKVTLRQLQEGGTLNLQDVLQMEYRLSQRFTEDKDFYEGVRAALVDRDNAPAWDPATIEGVTTEKVDWYFSRLPADRELVFSSCTV